MPQQKETEHFLQGRVMGKNEIENAPQEIPEQRGRHLLLESLMLLSRILTYSDEIKASKASLTSIDDFDTR